MARCFLHRVERDFSSMLCLTDKVIHLLSWTWMSGTIRKFAAGVDAAIIFRKAARINVAVTRVIIPKVANCIERVRALFVLL
mmetsp:Transcript_3518/g.7881  ORF Transcript_3518/g.7881 Transcript_3518/m.7881 type:complete len:82 (+) Transcript_3518:458-703(+)